MIIKTLFKGTLFLLLFVASVSMAVRLHPAKVTAGGMSDMGFKLFKSLYDNKKDDPIAISPMSISEAVILATHGSEKETREQLESIFLTAAEKKLGANLGFLTTGISNIRESLKKYAKASEMGGKKPAFFEYSSANSLWANTNEEVKFEFGKEFKKVAEDQFGATLFPRDFREMVEVDGEKVQKTVKEANDWVSKETRKKIKKLLSQLRDDDVAIILNAIYAKGLFRENFTLLEEGDYPGEPEQVTYMTKEEEGMSYYSDNKTVKAFSFNVGDKANYKLEDEVALDILVPLDGDLDTLVENLGAEYYHNLVKNLKPQDIRLTITAGKVEQEEAAKLKEVLKAKPFMVTRPFSEGSAQFGPLGSEITKRNIYISDILTKTFYEVTPFGFEAAAATAVVFARETAVLPPTFVNHKVDRASLHVIRHIPTGAPLFIVEYDSPKRYTEDEIVELIELGAKNSKRLEAKVKGGTIRRTWDEDENQVIALVKDGADGKQKVVKVFKKLN